MSINSGWDVQGKDVMPCEDRVVHVPNEECVCGPQTKCEILDDGSTVFYRVHHALDGREHREPDHNREECPLCSSPVWIAES